MYSINTGREQALVATACLWFKKGIKSTLQTDNCNTYQWTANLKRRQTGYSAHHEGFLAHVTHLGFAW